MVDSATIRPDRYPALCQYHRHYPDHAKPAAKGASNDTWTSLVSCIQENYVMDTHWDTGRKAGKYELRFRRSGKTLCTLYALENSFGFLVILYKKEREKFESAVASFTQETRESYDETKTCHDGKWLMLDMHDNRQMEDARALRAIKKKPNRK